VHVQGFDPGLAPLQLVGGFFRAIGGWQWPWRMPMLDDSPCYSRDSAAGDSDQPTIHIPTE
jgi:hypothetical protein